MTCQSRRWRMRSGADACACMFPERYDGHRDATQDRREDSVPRDVVGERLERQHEAVADDIAGDVDHVLWQRIVAAADEGQGAASQDQVDRRPWPGAVGDVVLELRHRSEEHTSE